MTVFKYQATNKEKETVSGALEAPNEHIASTILKEKGFSVISISKKVDKFRSINELSILNRVTGKEKVIFSRQFSVLISANVALVQSLKTLSLQIVNPVFRRIVTEIADDVDGGSRLSDALAKHPKVFSNFYISVVRSGETSGKLDEVLNYLADELEKDYDMMSKIKGAMIYPTFILVLMSAVGFFMMAFIMPKLTEIFTDSGTDLPWATRVLIAVSTFLSGYWWLVLAGVVVLIASINLFFHTAVGKRFFDSLLLSTPVFGPLFRKIFIVRFARSMNTLIVGGVNISNSLSIAAEVVNNDIFSDLISETRKEVEDGNSISSVFIQSKEVPRMVPQMLSTGEQTGRLDLVLEKITQFYTREINNTLANLMSLMEPIIIVVMATAVAVLVMAVITPMWNLASTFS